ncbi:hypothetical protein C8J57DRAFT_1223892 [Mycena rebaudengoi]|nr:hypothetical protein C8J57DRAFT_1223892 [Mycena rebaudengoi]
MPFPFALIARPPGDWQDVFDNQAIDMSLSHNMLIRGLNAIYAQAESIKEEHTKPFTFFCTHLLVMLHTHYQMEETLYFPSLEKKMGPHAMNHHLEQHSTAKARLIDFEHYLKDVQGGAATYSAQQLIAKLDSFSDKLVENLHDEIPTLASSKMRAAFTKKELEDLTVAVRKWMQKETSPLTSLPMLFICHNKSSAPYFPPIPKPVIWIAQNAPFRLYSDAWAFGPCDVNGVVKPGLGNDLETVPAAQNAQNAN